MIEMTEAKVGDKKSPNQIIESIGTDKCMQAGIECIDLHKIYSRGLNHALRGLNVKFYQNEISALLGHNGAGKFLLLLF